MAGPLDWLQQMLGGSQDTLGPALPQSPDALQRLQAMGDSVTPSFDRPAVPDTGVGTYWHNANQAAGDIGTAAAGLAERFNKGALNTLGFRQPSGDIYRGEIPAAPGLQRAGDVATFATGGLASPLSPAAGAYRQAAPVFHGLLADQAGALTLPSGFVRRTLDTSKPPLNPNDWNGSYLRGAGWYKPESGVIAGTHVTDDPSVVTKVLQSGGPITNRGPDKYGDLGPGLYFSDAPQVWGSRSRNKWDFLDDLTSAQRDTLAQALTKEVQGLPNGYVSVAERDAAFRDIDRFSARQSPSQGLLNVADQPYNIDFSDPKFLTGLGIRPSRQPVSVPIEVGGRFAHLDRNVYNNEADILRDLGYQGAFTQGGFSTTPQFVVWDRDAVNSFNGVGYRR